MKDKGMGVGDKVNPGSGLGGRERCSAAGPGFQAC